MEVTVHVADIAGYDARLYDGTPTQIMEQQRRNNCFAQSMDVREFVIQECERIGIVGRNVSERSFNFLLHDVVAGTIEIDFLSRMRVDRFSVKMLQIGLGFSEFDFASALNVSLGTLRSWKMGRSKPSYVSLKKLENLQRAYIKKMSRARERMSRMRRA